MLGHVIQIDENVIKIHYYADIGENIVYKLLKSCRSISKTKRYNCLFKGSIVSMESCFLFIVFYNIHQIIYVMEVNLSIDVCFLGELKRLYIRISRYLSFCII